MPKLLLKAGLPELITNFRQAPYFTLFIQRQHIPNSASDWQPLCKRILNNLAHRLSELGLATLLGKTNS